MEGMDAEVLVVDNHSVDGSVEMLRKKFPWVKLIANKDNTGFSKANNQAMRIAQGAYFLLLNPDTVVEEDTFRKVILFMDEHPGAGSLGVKMVDGRGHFLPESKRGLPTPSAAFYKIFGIARLFPRSKKFNQYHLGHLNKDEVHEVEILSGAFMLMRKATLDKVGLLDEAFFMYGEDIDLSWRIIKDGWKNYYFPHTRIIHYKGESTKKGSLNYVFVFYNAMVIFARKHFSAQNAKWFSFFINLAIWMRAGVAIANRFLKRALLPTLDASLSLAGLFLIKNYYAEVTQKIYDPVLVRNAFIAYVLVWCTGTWLSGAYDKPVRPFKIFKPVLIGSAVILIAYSLLPEHLRFSRALILLGTVVALLVFFLDRIIFNLISSGNTGLKNARNLRVALVGKPDETERVSTILSQTNSRPAFSICVSGEPDAGEGYVGSVQQLDEIVRVHNLDQVVFCARDISSSEIISAMSNVSAKSVEFKIVPPESLYIIGSGSIETSGDVFMMDVNSVSLLKNKRTKRLLDIALALVFIPLLPLMVFVVKNFAGFAANIVMVLIGKKSWIGFSTGNTSVAEYQLPAMKKGVLSPLSHLITSSVTLESTQKLNIVYAKDYHMMNDVRMVWRGFKHLGG